MGGMMSYLLSWVIPASSPQYDTTPDPATGLSQKDKVLIQESWALVADKKNIARNGVEFFIQLFEAYPYMQNYFALFKGKPISELRTSPKLRAHATSVMYALRSYVEMLDDTETLVGLVQKVAHSHIGRGITTDDFEKLRVVFLSFLKSVAGNQVTPDIEQAWNRLLITHNAVYKQCAEESGMK